MNCEKCGYSLPEDAVFCPNCGEQQPQSAVSPTATNCIKCGHLLPDGSDLCPKCGELQCSEDPFPAPQSAIEPTDKPADKSEPQPIDVPVAEPLNNSADIFVVQPIETADAHVHHPADTATVISAATPIADSQPLSAYNSAGEATAVVSVSPFYRKKWFLIAGSALAVILIALIVFLLWYQSPIQRFARSMKVNDFTNAKSCITEMSPNDTNNVQIDLLTRATEATNSYNSGVMTYEDANKHITELFDIYSFKALEDIAAGIESLKASKEDFKKAAEMEQDGDKIQAINQYGEVNTSDSNYQTAQEKVTSLKLSYKEEILQKAQALSDKQDFTGAVNLLNEAQKTLGKDEAVTAAMSSYDELAQSKAIADKIAQAQNLADDGDFSAALSVLTEINNNNADVTAKIAELKAACSDQAIADAKKSYEDSGYQSALGIISTALAVLPDNSELLAEKARYLSYTPVLASELKFLNSDNPELLGDNHESKPVEDFYGNRYEGGYYDLCSYGGSLPRKAYVELLTDGKYDYFRGVYFSRNGMDDSFQIAFKIYADDVLVFDSGMINRRTTAQKFDININRAKIIKIESESSDYTMMKTNPGIEVVNAEVYVK